MSKPPAGAGGVAQPAPSATWTMDTKPLDEPTNALHWSAGVLEAYIPQMHAQHAQAATERVAWLRELGNQIPFMHTDPVIMLCLSRVALDQRLRHGVAAAINRIESVTNDAARAHGTAT